VSEFEKQVAKNRLREDVQALNEKLKSEDGVQSTVQTLNNSEPSNEQSKRKSS
jgi:hypothetical protein